MDTRNKTMVDMALSELVIKLSEQIEHIKTYRNDQVYIHTKNKGRTWAIALIINADSPNKYFIYCDPRKYDIIGPRISYTDESTNVASNLINLIIRIPIGTQELTYLILAPEQSDSYVLLSNPKRYAENNKN